MSCHEKSYPGTRSSSCVSPSDIPLGIRMLSPQVHVRNQRRHRRVFLEGDLRLHFMSRPRPAGITNFVFIAARVTTRCFGGSFARRRFRPLIWSICSLSVRGIVHLQYDIGAGLDEPRLPWLQNVRNRPRRVADKEAASEPAADVATLRLPFSGTYGSPGNGILHPFRSRFPDERDHVVDDFTISRPHLRELNPFRPR